MEQADTCRGLQPPKALKKGFSELTVEAGSLSLGNVLPGDCPLECPVALALLTTLPLLMLLLWLLKHFSSCVSDPFLVSFLRFLFSPCLPCWGLLDQSLAHYSAHSR